MPGKSSQSDQKFADCHRRQIQLEEYNLVIVALTGASEINLEAHKNVTKKVFRKSKLKKYSFDIRASGGW